VGFHWAVKKKNYFFFTEINIMHKINLKKNSTGSQEKRKAIERNE
jgi:hypothetical protein